MARRLQAVRSAGAPVMLAALVLTHAGLLAAVLARQPWMFVACLLAATASDVVVRVRRGGLVRVLGRAHFGAHDRQLVRELTTLALVSQAGAGGTRNVLAAALLVLVAARAGWLATLVRLRSSATSPVDVRNIDVTGVPMIAPLNPSIVRDSAPWHLAITMLPPLLVALAVATDGQTALVAAAVASVVPVVLQLARVVVATLQRRREPSREAQLSGVNDRVRRLDPEVVLYFSGARDAAYQINMWLPVVDRTSRRTLIVLRERVSLGLLGPTRAPVVCIPGAVDLMTFPMESVKVALYVANVGKNIHFLRLPGIKHVFIGHGDSDKIASVNPFTKVHDEVWVAGRAGRERYRVAQVGVRDDSIVEVGRPQLGEIRQAAARRPGDVLTVLYAPTWEGWTNDPWHTSIIQLGPHIVRRLLERRDVRIVYKPHPLTGTVQAAASAAHREIVALLDADLAARGSARGAVGDRSEAALPPREPGEDSIEDAQRYARWSEQWWGSLEPWRHAVVGPTGPTLYDCFNHADLLVSDVSSVVADWVASEKPYAVTNGESLPDHHFRERYPTARAAYLVEPQLAGLDQAVAAVTGDDPFAVARRDLRAYLLGASDRDPLQRWNDELDRLVAQARSTWPDAHPWADAAQMPEDPATRPS